MKQLLTIEWLKIKKYSTFWILTGIFVSLYLLWNLGIKNSTVSFNQGPMKVLSETYSFPGVWANMGYIYSWFVVFLVVFIIISITNEFSFKTHRQHIIDGMKRLDFLHGKAFLILAFSLGGTLFYWILSVLFGLTGGTGNLLDDNQFILYVFLYTLNYLSFAGLIAFLVKRSGLSITFFFAYLLLETILGGLINKKLDTSVGDLFPLQSSDELLPFPLLDTLGKMSGLKGESLSPEIYVGASVVWIAAYYLFLRRRMQVSDL